MFDGFPFSSIAGSDNACFRLCEKSMSSPPLEVINAPSGIVDFRRSYVNSTFMGMTFNRDFAATLGASITKWIESLLCEK